jgi:membrane protein
MARLAAWWGRTRPGRTLARYGSQGGAVLAGGIAYSALFSLFAALTISFTVFAAAAGRDSRLREAVVQTVDGWLPGAIADRGAKGLVSADRLVDSSLVSATGAVAAVVLAFAAVSFVSALRTSIRAMFGLRDAPDNALASKARAFAGLGLLALAVLVSSAVSIAASAASGWLGRTLGLGEAAGTAAGVLASAASLAIDAGAVAVLFRWVAAARPPRRDLVWGALGAAAVMSAVRHVGTRVVAHSTANALLASVATLATLLVWVNLMARIVLYAAAWTAVGAAHPGGKPAGCTVARVGRRGP